MRLHKNLEGRRFGRNWSSLTDRQIRDLSEGSSGTSPMRDLIYMKFDFTAVPPAEPQQVAGKNDNLSARSAAVR